MSAEPLAPQAPAAPARLPPDLQTWIAENVSLGATPESLIQTLVRLGHDAALVGREVAAAEGHPYVEAARLAVNRVRRREALMKTLDAQLRPADGYLAIRKAALPPFADFLRDYYRPNRLGVFTGGFDHWPARRWTPQILLEKIGADTEVQVQSGRELDRNYESNAHHHRSTIGFGTLVRIMETMRTNDIYMTANNQAFQSEAFRPLHGDIGQVGDGYLNLEQKDGTHLWMGPSGIVTPLHHDLTNNLFFQVYGFKRVRLIPALQVPYMYNRLHVFSDLDLLAPDLNRFPAFGDAAVLDVTLGPGDIMFIPIGWWHHVVGETVTISLTLTNFAVPNQMVDYPITPARM